MPRVALIGLTLVLVLAVVVVVGERHRQAQQLGPYQRACAAKVDRYKHHPKDARLKALVHDCRQQERFARHVFDHPF